MTYIDGFVVPVLPGKKEEYRKMAADAAPIFQEYGAIGIVDRARADGDETVDGMHEPHGSRFGHDVQAVDERAELQDRNDRQVEPQAALASDRAEQRLLGRHDGRRREDVVHRRGGRARADELPGADSLRRLHRPRAVRAGLSHRLAGGRAVRHAGRDDPGADAGRTAQSPHRGVRLREDRYELEVGQLGTELGVFYNVYGPRISEVGVLRIPDVFEQPFHRLDVSLTQRLPGGFGLKLSASNLLDQSVVLRQGPIEVYRMSPGVQFFASLSWALNSEGRK